MLGCRMAAGMAISALPLTAGWSSLSPLKSSKDLKIAVGDVEGGAAAILFLTPEHKGSMRGGDGAVIRPWTVIPISRASGVHATVRYPDLNGDPNYIANLDQQPDEGCPISVDITPRGAITVTNGRNKFSKVYHSRGK